MADVTAGYRATHLYLVRHGQAVVNVQPIIGGMRGDTGLTERGIQQAERVRDRLAREIRPDVLIASPLPRARQTAEIIADGIGHAVEFDPDLEELRVGPEGDGLSLEEYRERFGWVDLAQEPFRVVDPGGESWATFMLRVATGLDRITREHEGKIVLLVTHGGVIDGSFVHFFGMNAHALPRAGFATENTSITHWIRLLKNGVPRWTLSAYNDTAHLRDVQHSL
jgi:2,3-bisphosphoglycerate-dependent phosphoglycerate mutase